MGRYSPTVLPQPVLSPFASFLAQGAKGAGQAVENRYAKRMQDARDQRAQELFKAQMRGFDIRNAQTGFMPEAAKVPIEAPSSPVDTTGPLDAYRATKPTVVGPSSPTDLAGALRGDIGGTATAQTGAATKYLPGDVRSLSPATELASGAPGRIGLPSGGSIPEMPPAEQYKRYMKDLDRRMQYQSLVATGMTPTRAWATVELGRNLPAEPPVKGNPRYEDLIAVGVPPAVARHAANANDGGYESRTVFASYSKKQKPGLNDYQMSRGYSDAYNFALSNANATIHDIENRFGLTGPQAGHALVQAQRDWAMTPEGQKYGNAAYVYARPVNDIQRGALTALGHGESEQRIIDHVMSKYGPTTKGYELATQLRDYFRTKDRLHGLAALLMGGQSEAPPVPENP